MKIAQIKISNYRCIKSLDFIPSIHNILIGRVNSGKSTILRALSLVLDPDIGRRYRFIEDLDFFEGKTLDDEGNPIPIKIEVTLSDCSSDERNQFFECWEPWDTQENKMISDSDDISIFDDPRYVFAFRIAFEAKYDKNEKELIYFWYYPKFSFLDESDEYRQCYRPDREKVGFFLIPAERDIGKALSFTRYSALDKALRADKITLDDEIAKISDSMQGLGNRLFDNKSFEQLIKEIESQIEIMLELNPTIARKLVFEISGLGHYDIMNILRPFVVPEGAPRPYPVANQGMGAKQIITLATLRMLAARKKGCILAIEEPELSLHPHIQRSLVSDLLSTDCQTFITTHSVHVSQVPKQSFIYSILDLGNGAKKLVSIEPSKETGYSEGTVKAIKRIRAHYPSDILDSLFAPRVLLVEGPGDREALPVLIRKLCSSDEEGKSYSDLDGLGIAVVQCEGKQAIPKVAPYFKSVGKIVYALADSEKTTYSINDDITNACSCSFFWPEKTAIEKVLLDNVYDETISRFIAGIAELGDDFFEHAGTHTKDSAEKRKDVLDYLKNRSGHRQFAEFVSIKEIFDSVRILIRNLNRVCSGEDIGNKVMLNAEENT